MRALVTGGAGFIGSHLVDALVEQGHEVTVVDNLEPQVHKLKPTYLNARAKYVFEDIRAKGVLEDNIAGMDVVFHLASMVGVGQSTYQISRYVDTNVSGTAKLLQTLVDRRHDVRKLIVASSMSIYGEGSSACPKDGLVSPPLRTEAQMRKGDWKIHCPACGHETKPLPTGEDKPLMPNSVYAVTKRDQEELCLAVGRSYGLPTVALRFFNVYGPRQSLDNPYTGVAAIFQSRIKNDTPPVVFEDGLQSRDFVSVHDVIQALLLSSEKNGADYEAVNVGSGAATSILDVAKGLIALYGSKLDPSVTRKFRAGDVRHCFSDITKIRRLLGYNPNVSFESGMRELVAWGRTVSAKDGFENAYAELRSRGLLGE